MNAAVLCLALAAALDEAGARALSNMLAAGAASDPRVDALAQADLRVALELEATRQGMGCDAGATSCLAELAAALGASLVLYAEVGELGGELLVSVSLLDSTNGMSGGRTVVRGATASAVADDVHAAAASLLARFLAAHPPAAATRLRVLVLDVRGAAPASPGASSSSSSSSSSTSSAAPMPWLLVGAGAAGVLGAGALVGAVVLDQAAADARRTVAQDKEITQLEAQRRLDDGDALGFTGVALYAVGGALAVAGVGLAVWHVVE